MSRIIKLRDVEGTVMLLSLDDIIGIRIPSELTLKQGELHIALVMLKGVNLNMTVDLANKLIKFLEDDIINKDDEINERKLFLNNNMTNINREKN